MSITKRDLVVKIAKETGLIQQDVGKIIQMTLDNIAAEVAAGKTVELRNFGVFETVIQRRRIGRNPRQPEKTVVIPEHMVAKFKAGKKLKAKIEALKSETLKK
ncbi:MAG: HU family DNA-binding protein [Victivallaceae bacterium]|jgi:nucleoid DNA-binding protein